MSRPRIVAVDWSGAQTGAQRKIWLAEAREGAVVRLEDGRSRPELEAHLVEDAGRDAGVVIGLDFGFSLPAWFMREQGFASAPQLWAHLAGDRDERWLARCEPPFWGRPGTRRPSLDPMRPFHRACERGIGAKSVFQVGGAGAVGTGSLRGMPMLHRLLRAGFHVWPYDAPGFPLVVEIYPRQLTGALRKSNPAARAAYIERWQRRATVDVPGALLERARASEDAFDALFSAIAMWDHVDDLCTLPAISDPLTRFEGAIWYPGWAAHRRICEV
jgi:hypothetical protein